MAFWSASSHLLGVLTAGKGKGGGGGVKFWLRVLLPLPPQLKQAASALNNHTVLEYGTLAKSRFVVAQPARRLLQKTRNFWVPNGKRKERMDFYYSFFGSHGAYKSKLAITHLKEKCSWPSVRFGKSPDVLYSIYVHP